jgi:hypothetical protein
MPSKLNTPLFLAVFLAAFLIQSSYFRMMSFVDNDRWITRTVNLSQDIFTHPIHLDFYDKNNEPRYSPHPGTTIILLSSLLFKSGLSGQTSLLLAITFLTSFLTASAASVCHYLRPYSSWWLVAAIILIIHPLYFYSTPTNAVIGPATALLFLLALAVYEKRSQPISLRLTVFISFVIGIGLSTRLHDTVFIAAPLLAFIGAYISTRRLLLMMAVSALFAILFNPFYWFVPIEFIKSAILRTSSSIVYTGFPGFHLTPLWALYYTPLTIISIALAVLFFIYARPTLPLSSPFILTLFLITATTTGLFLSVQSQTLRYLYPLIFTWDVLLPLFLLRLSDQIHFSFITNTRYLALARQLTRLFIVSAIIFGFGFLAVYNLILPGSTGLI